MKTNFTMAFLLFAIFLTGCQEENIDKITPQSEPEIDPELLKGNVYPLSQAYQDSRILTRSGSAFETDWENQTKIILASGNEISLPWSTTTDANLPYDLVTDIKKKDGWQLIYHSFISSPYPMAERNYMIFHNTRTGTLKIYYYKEGNYVPNNTCVWTIGFNYPQQLFNFTEEIAHPISLGQAVYVQNTTLSTTQDKGVKNGWNCFQTNLAYAPNSTQVIDITANTLNISDVNLFNQYQESSSGVILTQSSANPLDKFTGKIANIAGESASKWIKQEIDGNKIKDNAAKTRGLIGSVVVGSVGSIVKAGVNKVLNAFTGRFRKTVTQKQEIQINTKGNGQITGNISFNSSAPILSLRTDFSKERVGELGVWNLKESPTVYINPLANHKPGPMDSYGEYTYTLRGISGYKYNLTINPVLAPHITKQWIDIDMVHYWNFTKKAPAIPSNYTNFGSLGGLASYGLTSLFDPADLLYESQQDTLSIYRDQLKATITATRDLYTQYGRPLSVVFLPNTATRETKRFDKNHFLKFTLYIVTNIEGQIDTTVSTRTFIPKIEWDPQLYSRYAGYSPQDLEQIAGH